MWKYRIMNKEQKFAPINQEPLTAIFSDKHDYQNLECIFVLADSNCM
jgi:hypothetical protein